MLSSMLLGLFSPAVTHAITATQIREAQTIMRKFGIPAGPVDGKQGAMTKRGLCAFRYMSGMSVSRNSLDTATLSKLRSYNKSYASLGQIPARANSTNRELLVAHETCQAMTYSVKASNGKHYYKRVMAISTARPGKTTPNGTFSLGFTQRGWSCSSRYPESCVKQTTGRFATSTSYGNMYNFRAFHQGNLYGIHGSTSVPTYPASAGCIRVTVADSDWMFSNVGNNGNRPVLIVTGSY